MDFWDMNRAVVEAERTIKYRDSLVADMAHALKGRLRVMPDVWRNRETLAALKKELTQFNAKTMRWKN